MTPAELHALRKDFQTAKNRLCSTVAHCIEKGESLDDSHAVYVAFQAFVAARDAYYDAED